MLNSEYQKKALYDLLNIEEEPFHNDQYKSEIQQYHPQSKTLDYNTYARLSKGKSIKVKVKDKSQKDLSRANKYNHSNTNHSKNNQKITNSNKQSLKDLLLRLQSKQISTEQIQINQDNINVYFNTLENEEQMTKINVENRMTANRYSIVFRNNNNNVNNLHNLNKNDKMPFINQRIRLPLDEDDNNMMKLNQSCNNYGESLKMSLHQQKDRKSNFIINNNINGNNFYTQSDTIVNKIQRNRPSQPKYHQKSKRTYKKKLQIKYSRLSNKQNQHQQTHLQNISHHNKTEMYQSIGKKTFQILQQINNNRSFSNKGTRILHTNSKKGTVLKSSILEMRKSSENNRFLSHKGGNISVFQSKIQRRI